jgi:hypothetical protein
VKRAAPIVTALLAIAAPAAAQIPDLPTLGPAWTDLAFPKLYWNSTEGFTAGLFYAQIMQLGYDDWDAPAPYRAQLSLDGDIAASGSKRLRLEARMPKLIDGWRFLAALEGRRDARERYFGIGNGSTFDKTNESDDNPYYYRSDAQRIFGRVEVQRRIIGGLRLFAGVHAERWRIDTLSGASQLATDRSSGADATIGRTVGDVSTRLGIVFDTRNDEPAPTRGVLLEAIVGFADSTFAGGVSYRRATLSARAYLPLRYNLAIAARIAGQSMSGTPPLGSYYHFEASDRPFRTLGGSDSHRAIPPRRLLDADKLLANLDIRYDLIVEPTLFRVTAVGFVDAGRVFPSGKFKLTTEDLMVGGGAGLLLQLFRTGIIGTTGAVGPDGVVFFLHTWWPF